MSNESELRQIVANLSDGPTVCVRRYAPKCGVTHQNRPSVKCTICDSSDLDRCARGTRRALSGRCSFMNDREAKARAVKILAKSIYRDLEAQGFDEKQIVALATELISEVTNKISKGDHKSQQVA